MKPLRTYAWRYDDSVTVGGGEFRASDVRSARKLATTMVKRLLRPLDAFNDRDLYVYQPIHQPKAK